MTEEIIVPDKEATKKEKYELLIPQIKALVEGESDLIANIANIVAALKEGMNFFWIGAYFVKENSKAEKELVLGPFQGPVACTRIQFGKGVCGESWMQKQIIIVDDVDKFPGHIACNSLSKSEIVLPVFKNNDVALIMDVDSDQPANFDKTDHKYLVQITDLIEGMLK
jgi:GAF domain-containing protein